jgi:hypothetical protein
MWHGNRLILILCLMMLFVSSPGGQLAAQTPGGTPAGMPALKGHPKITVQGTIKNLPSMGGYYIRSRGEVYAIANQNPQVLEELAQSGRTVNIEARSQGDLLTIETIDGQGYVGSQVPGTK